MSRLTVWPFLAICLMLTPHAYAGSGFQSFPQSDFMKRKVGAAPEEQKKDSPGLDAFYRWKQQSMADEEADAAVSAGEDSPETHAAPRRSEADPAAPASPSRTAEKPPMTAPGIPLPQPGKQKVTSQGALPVIEMRSRPFDEPDAERMLIGGEPPQPASELAPSADSAERTASGSASGRGGAAPVAETVPVPEARPVAAAPMRPEPVASASTDQPAPTGEKSWLGRLFSGDSVPETSVTPTVPPEYILGVGDVIEISVWKDEALSKVVPILPDGTIHFPLLGRLKAAGKTVEGLRNEMETQITKFVPSPFVDVSVTQVNSMMIYIIGKVHNPGRFAINANVTVLQALSMAGGLNTFADGDRIKVIRQGEGGEQVIPFNYDDAASGRDLRNNIRLRRGDVIVVN